MNHIIAHLFGITITGWKLVGYSGAFMFTSRWFVQLYASTRAGKPVMTRWFWILSLIGSINLLLYFVFGKNDSVGIISNSFPTLIAGYNLFLDIRYKKQQKSTD